jgi:hypothetical protein
MRRFWRLLLKYWNIVRATYGDWNDKDPAGFGRP